ncbi:MAG: hypothetical protein LAT76_09885 [Schleiferiaceae bacterium]|nr:hypothetical protein [Schleiferiaceae bacterium]
MRLFSLVLMLIAVGLFTRCQQSGFEVDVSRIQVNASLDVIHLDFFEADEADFETNLEALRTRYPFFYGSGTLRFWKTHFEDPLQKKLVKDIRKQFPDFDLLESDVVGLLKHYRYHFPDAHLPHPVAYFSNLDFDFPVLVADTFIFVALDLYLGAAHPAYKDLPNYLAAERDKTYLIRDIAEQLAKGYIAEMAPDATFINEMIYQGLVHYFIKSMIPSLSDAHLFKYTEEQLQFCVDNERMIWSYFIDNELLFSTSLDPKRRFIYPAPFSKFRTSFDAQTPGRIGQWMGYQIVKAYAETHSQAITDLLQPVDGATFLKKSKYKPK